MIYPSFCKEGDTIGIVAPSAGVVHKLEHYEKALQTLKDEGYFIKESASVRNAGFVSASAKQRGKEWNEIYSDPTVKYVLCAAGGDFLMEMLEYMDLKAMAKHPKWFMGMSDPSTILYMLPTALDIASVYSTNAGGFDPLEKDDAFLHSLEALKGEVSVQHSFSSYMVGLPSEDAEKAAVYWDSFGRDIDVQGRLIGGCVDALQDIVGTRFDYTASFLEKYKEDGFIWFIDNFALSYENLYHCLFLMKEHGWFKYCKAVMMGRTLFPSGFLEDFSYAEALKRIFKDIPLVMEADIGHTVPYFTLINGAVAHLKVSEGQATLWQEYR